MPAHGVRRTHYAKSWRPSRSANYLSVKRLLPTQIHSVLLTESSEHEDKSTDASGDMPPQPCPPETPTLTATDAPEEEGEAPKSPQDSQENDEMGPLPDNWEMAYTEKGEVYFIEWVKCTSMHACDWGVNGCAASLNISYCVESNLCLIKVWIIIFSSSIMGLIYSERTKSDTSQVLSL